MLNTPRALKRFLILAPHPKALRQIGKLGFFGTNSGSVYEPLMWEVRFVLKAERGDRSIIGKLGFFGTNSGSVYEPLMLEVRFLLEWGGDRSIGEANLRKGRQPLQWKCASRLAGTPRAWMVRLVPDSRFFYLRI